MQQHSTGSGAAYAARTKQNNVTSTVSPVASFSSFAAHRARPLPRTAQHKTEKSDD